MTPPNIDLAEICPELAEVFTFDKVPYFCRGCIPVDERIEGIECMGHERYSTPSADTKRFHAIAATMFAQQAKIEKLEKFKGDVLNIVNPKAVRKGDGDE